MIAIMTARFLDMIDTGLGITVAPREIRRQGRRGQHFRIWIALTSTRMNFRPSMERV